MNLSFHIFGQIYELTKWFIVSYCDLSSAWLRSSHHWSSTGWTCRRKREKERDSSFYMSRFADSWRIRKENRSQAGYATVDCTQTNSTSVRSKTESGWRTSVSLSNSCWNRTGSELMIVFFVYEMCERMMSGKNNSESSKSTLCVYTPNEQAGTP